VSNNKIDRTQDQVKSGDDHVAEVERELTTDNKTSKGGPTQATTITDLAKLYYDFFHSAEGTAYALVEKKVNNTGVFKQETVPLRSRLFREYLSALYYHQTKAVASRTSIDAAISVLSGETTLSGREEEVFVRLAEFEGATWLDLADDLRRAVMITEEGWEIVSGGKIPVKFRRPLGMYALPEPKHPKPEHVGYSLKHLLAPFLNVHNREHMQLLLTWLAFTQHTTGAYPIVCVIGEQGTAKSTMCRLLRNIVDPNQAALVSAPRNTPDLVIAANNSLVLGFDNIIEHCII